MTKEKGGPKAALSFARSPILRRAGNLEQSNYGFADVKHRPPEKVVRCQKWTRPPTHSCQTREVRHKAMRVGIKITVLS